MKIAPKVEQTFGAIFILNYGIFLTPSQRVVEPFYLSISAIILFLKSEDTPYSRGICTSQ